MNPPILSFIIVNWNTKHLLCDCIQTILDTTDHISSEIIVVDNASRDGSPAEVKNTFPQVLLLAQSENRGFACGVNAGIRAAKGQNFVILNPDICFQRDTMTTLLNFLTGHPDVGVVTPRLVNKAGTVRSGYTRKLPSTMQIVLFHSALAPWSEKQSWLVRRYLEEQRNTRGESTDVEQIPGAFMVVPRHVVETVGLMDEGFGLFFEDVDWSYRIRRAGFRLCEVSNATAIHIGGQSFQRPDNYWMFGRFVASALRFFDIHYSRFSAYVLRALMVFNSIAVFGMTFILKKNDSVLMTRRKHKYFLRLMWARYLQGKEISLAVS